MRLILILIILLFVQCLMACSVVDFYNIKFGAPSAISTNNLMAIQNTVRNIKMENGVSVEQTSVQKVWCQVSREKALMPSPFFTQVKIGYTYSDLIPYMAMYDGRFPETMTRTECINQLKEILNKLIDENNLILISANELGFKSTFARYKCIDKKSKLELTLEGVEGNKGRRFWMWVKMKLAID